MGMVVQQYTNYVKNLEFIRISEYFSTGMDKKLQLFEFSPYKALKKWFISLIRIKHMYVYMIF